jgi:hypothetical protein
MTLIRGTARSLRARISRSAAFLLIGLAAGLLVAPALASVVQAFSLEELTRKADLIVVGVGGETEARRNPDGRLIVTDISVSVQDVLKGSAKKGESIVVTVLGGNLDGLGLRVPGEASIPLGKPALLFLYRGGAAGTDLRVVGMAQGVMPMQPSDQGTMMIIPGGSSSALVQRDSSGTLKPASAALLQPEPAASVLDRVRAAVGKQSPH